MVQTRCGQAVAQTRCGYRVAFDPRVVISSRRVHLEEQMPTYQYRCRTCDAHFEVRQSFSENSLTRCPASGSAQSPAACASPGEGELRKVFSAPSITFKGEGFYKTDSRSKSTRPAGDKGDKGDKADGKSSDGADSSKGSSKDSSASSSKDSADKASGGSGGERTPTPAAAS